MKIVYFNESPTEVGGQMPEVGVKAPEFSLVGADLSEVSLSDFSGKRLVLNIFPSIDTDVCARSVRKFNEVVSSMKNTIVLCVSMDLPFASARFCAANGIDNVKTVSAFRSDFGKCYGVEIVSGPLRGLFARSVVVIDEEGKVIKTMLCQQQTEEPDYNAVIECLAHR